MPKGMSLGCPARISIPLLSVGVVSLDDVVRGDDRSRPPFSSLRDPGLRPSRGEVEVGPPPRPPPSPPRPPPSLEFILDFLDSILPPASLVISYGLKGTALAEPPPSLTMIVGLDDLGTEDLGPFRSDPVIDFCLSEKAICQMGTATEKESQKEEEEEEEEKGGNLKEEEDLKKKKRRRRT